MDDIDNYYLGAACEWWDDRNPADFYQNITAEIIDNRCTERRTGRNQTGKPIKYCGYIRNIVPHYTTTKKNRKINTPNGLVDTRFPAQSRCKVFGSKATYVCSNFGD